jgi:hypothetical protein
MVMLRLVAGWVVPSVPPAVRVTVMVGLVVLLPAVPFAVRPAVIVSGVVVRLVAV